MLSKLRVLAEELERLEEVLCSRIHLPIILDRVQRHVGKAMMGARVVVAFAAIEDYR